ncbi:uncharacterized protein LOC116253929 isoform X2 [Nymphaea colorata]|uniref:uncharacterized protein LOC116253929 isoform X1 n=1 Tax=Nymphaea colorata TaxID=210225 RepID=UPI00214ED2FB|nr:uncharacterized protein LOC116253929 isoform X1 [Nymphaea colorata]XP_049933791.1 uncharacterized protein LOC116253929 isoform X2 [Nymphaea colorata]
MHDGVLGVSLCFKRFSDLRTKRETSHHPRRLNSSDIHIAGAASEIDASGCLVSIYGLVKQVEHIDFWTELCLFVHFQGYPDNHYDRWWHSSGTKWPSLPFTNREIWHIMDTTTIAL